MLNPLDPDPTLLLRLILYAGEVYRAPEVARGIRVRNGLAWISFAGRDLIASNGSTTWLAPQPDFALISPVGNAPLIVEVLAGRPACPPLPAVHHPLPHRSPKADSYDHFVFN